MEPIQSNKIYPIGIQNFEKMRKGGYFYVDTGWWIFTYPGSTG